MGKNTNLAPIKALRRRLESDWRIERLILFGSRARGMARPDSDWDVIIVSPDFSRIRFHERMRRLYRYWNYRRYGAFEPLPYTPAEFSRLAQEPTIVREAVREGYQVD